MPRRNRNSQAKLVSRDMLADQLTRLARELTAPIWCAGCGTSPATDGGYCALCTGLIIFAARRTALGRR
jgi:hypothetical protein